MTLKIGISGKRYINNNDHSIVERELLHAIELILDKSKQTSFLGICMLAAGADSIFASLVLDHFKQPLHVILPFPQAEFEMDFNDEEKSVFRVLLSRAKKVTILKLREETRGKNIEPRNNRFREAGLEIANHVTNMLFVWDGRKPIGEGGTADILSYFSEHHSAEKWQVIETLPEKQSGLQYQLEVAYSQANSLSIKNKIAHDRVWKLSILFGWIAVSFFSIKVAFELTGRDGLFMTLTETVLILAVACIVINARKNKFHINFLKERIKAEQLRVLIQFFHIGAQIEIPIFAERSDLELSKFIAEINKQGKAPDYQSKWYSNYIIKKLIADQKTYHSKKIKQIGHKPEHIEFIKNIVAITFILNLLSHFILKLGQSFDFISESPKWVEHASTFMSILLPATYAALEGFLSFEDWAKMKNHSSFVIRNLNHLENMTVENLSVVDNSACLNQQVKQIKEIGTTMLNDNINWQIINGDKSNYHWII